MAHITELTAKIRGRGFYDVVIHPTEFDENRIEYSLLLPTIERVAVVSRGWSLPYVRESSVERHIDCISQEGQWLGHHLEAWRFFLSGQLAILTGFTDDWRDESEWWPAAPDWVWGKELGVFETIFRYTEIMELAARLALTDAGGDSMTVAITLSGLSGRALKVDLPGRAPFFESPTTSLLEFPWESTLTRDVLVADPRGCAIRPLVELFARFGWTRATPEEIRSLQSEIDQIRNG